MTREPISTVTNQYYFYIAEKMCVCGETSCKKQFNQFSLMMTLTQQVRWNYLTQANTCSTQTQLQVLSVKLFNITTNPNLDISWNIWFEGEIPMWNKIPLYSDSFKVRAFICDDPLIYPQPASKLFLPTLEDSFFETIKHLKSPQTQRKEKLNLKKRRPNVHWKGKDSMKYKTF